MPTDVVMPQMGESIAEGTIVRWIKKVGDSVDRDEPLFEISTDKVDAEIPSPAAGVLVEIRATEGTTVPVDSVVAVIAEAGWQPGAAPSSNRDQVLAPTAGASRSTSAKSGDEEGERRHSPVVRRIAQEHGIDLSKLTGSGAGGRITKDDVLTYVDRARTAAPTAGSTARRELMSPMRKKIADHMVTSRQTSAHVHTVFEVNLETVARLRKQRDEEFLRAGTKLTYLAFILAAAAEALRSVPLVNASVDGDTIVYHDEVNIGVAVSLDWGLIVPVIRHVDRQDLLALSRTIADIAERARHKQLKPEEVSGGTFTVTNHGASGSLFGMPIINQPQVAILGVGQIAKRPAVVDDRLEAQLNAYFTLGFDHRLLDGAVADQFMAHVKRKIENFEAQGR